MPLAGDASAKVEPPTHLVVLTVDAQRFGLSVASVDRVVRAVEVTPLPNAPRTVLGVIDVRGQIVPVVCLRRRAGLPGRAVEPTDQIVLVRTGGRLIGLLVDAAQVGSCGPAEWTTTADVLPGTRSVHGLVTRADGLVLVYDPEQLLEPGEAAAVDAAVDEAAAGDGGAGPARVPDGVAG